MTTQLESITPGDILRDEFMADYGLSQNKLALALHVPVSIINRIVNNKYRITAELALRLSTHFGTWLPNRRISLPRTWVTTFVARAVNKPCHRSRIGVRPGDLADACGYPSLWIVSNIAKEFHLDLIGRMESVCGPVRLIQRAKGISPHAVKIKIVTATGGAAAERSTAMATTRAIVPVVLAQPTVPTFVHKIAGT